jgi:hypothetical protein
MHDVMARHVDSGEVPGLVTLISHHGEVHFDTIGTKAIGDDDPMRRDTTSGLDVPGDRRLTAVSIPRPAVRRPVGRIRTCDS